MHRNMKLDLAMALVPDILSHKLEALFALLSVVHILTLTHSVSSISYMSAHAKPNWQPHKIKIYIKPVLIHADVM